MASKENSGNMSNFLYREKDVPKLLYYLLPRNMRLCHIFDENMLKEIYFGFKSYRRITLYVPCNFL